MSLLRCHRSHSSEATHFHDSIVEAGDIVLEKFEIQEEVPQKVEKKTCC